jgi:myo-inositol-1(or 4)-monophosphatase
MDNIKLESLCQEVRHISNDTAQFIRAEFGKVGAGQIEEKFLNGLVSYVDRHAEEMLVERLSALLPEAAFITEEDTVEQKKAEMTWIIDPLDGTTNFLYGVPHFSISIGLQVGAEMVIGLVHHVPSDEQFYAWKGGGAWCNNQRIRVSQRHQMRQALVSTGFPYHNFERAESWFAVLNELMASGRGVRRFGSAALDLAWVACGRFDVFFEYGLNAWDVAAGILLVQEAGGRVSDFSGNEGLDLMEKKEIMASNAGVYEVTLEIMKRHF